MERDAYIDNARLVLIFFVVFGHMIQPFVNDSQMLNTLYLWVYTFVMPAFILLSGFFAKGITDKHKLIGLAKKLLIPYVLFQLIYTGYYFFIGKDGWQTSLFYPHWALWFLLSLFCWHVLLTLFKKIKPLAGISIAILLGLIVGYVGDIGHSFSLSRTIVFFPFFLIGYWITREQLMKVKMKQIKQLSIGVMVIVAITIYATNGFQTGWLLSSKSYSDLGYPSIGAPIRLLTYVTKAAMAISVLAWIPKQQMLLTHLGERTIYVYLLHGFFIQFFRENNLFAVNGFFAVFGLATLSAMIVIVLSHKVTLTFWQPVVEGKASIIRNTVKQRSI